MTMLNIFLLWKFFALAFSALIPLVNPLGSSLLIVGFVGPVPLSVYRSLARRIAINVVIFLAVIQLIGSAILNFFGISLPIVQVSGGLVIAAMGWSLLNQQSTESSNDDKKSQVDDNADIVLTSINEKSFYPFTFPLTVGPGCIVVTLTLSAQALQHKITGTLIAHSGIILATMATSVLVYLCYANAPRITKAIAPSTAHGILRVIAFFLFCIGVQITWTGLSALLTPFLHH
jgi:multiple antibiotic resistance protein